MNFNTAALNITYFISVALSYMILVSIAGYLQALIAKWMGDDTAEQQGFLTLNPAIHVDFVGLLTLIFSYLYTKFFFGWGRRVPIDPAKISGRFRVFKIFIAMFSGVVAYILFAALGLALMAYLIHPNNAFGNIEPSALNSVSVISVLRLYIALCIILATVEFIYNIAQLCTIYFLGKQQRDLPTALFISLIISLVILILYGNQLLILMAAGSTALAKLIAKFLFGT